MAEQQINNDHLKQLEHAKLQAEIDKLKMETTVLSRPAILKPSALVPMLAALVGLATAWVQYQATTEQLTSTTDKLTSTANNLIKEQDAKQASDSHAAGLQQKLSTMEQTIASAVEQPSNEIKRAFQRVITENRLPESVPIQYSSGIDRNTIAGLQGLFNGKGMPSPYPEYIDSEFGNSIRYYHSDDQQLAESVKEITTQYFVTQECPISIESRFVANHEHEVKLGVIELWLNHRCN